jgi:hypothetical protein
MKKLLTLVLLAFPMIASAQTAGDFGTDRLLSTNLGNQPLEDTIAGIINIFLGFLGILATILLLYAGFLWMTSKGNAEKIARAKLLISSALIGLVIILTSYAISQFVLRSLINETTDGVPAVACGGPLDCTVPPNLCCLVSGFCGSCAVAPVDNCYEPGTVTNGFVVPGGPDDPRICSLSTSSGQAGSGITIKGWHFDVVLPENDPDVGGVTIGMVTINGVPAEVVECAGSPMWYDRKVKVKVPNSVPPGLWPLVITNDAGNDNTTFETFNFTVLPGTSLVNIDCIVPGEAAAGPISELPMSVDILGDGFDIAGTATINTWTLAGAEFRDTLTTSAWTDLQIEATIPPNALDSYVEVTVGGVSDTEPFDITCDDDLQCASECCSGNSCLPASVCDAVTIIPGPNDPVIQSVSPEDGDDNTIVTIEGYNFCAGETCVDPPIVTMNGQPAPVIACIAPFYSDSYVLAEVPAGFFVTDDVLDIVVTQAAVHGAAISDAFAGFTMTDESHPGICSLSAPDGVFGQTINITGANFSPADDDDTYFDTVLSQTDFINANSIDTQIPNVVGAVGVRIKNTSDVYSNALPFTALASLDGLPVITEITPDNGSVDAYITIRGSNFGDIQGVVRFDTIAQNEPGLFDFPAVCGNTWSDNEIIVKVPAGTPPWVIGADYLVDVVRAIDSVDSNDYEFTINNSLLGPQICAISPNNGLSGEPVIISGENFGPSVGGQVMFHEGAPAAPTNWFSNQISGMLVPVDTQTGPVIITDATGNPSNPVLFTVGSCDNDGQCGGARPWCCPGAVGNSCVVNTCDFTLNAASYSWEIETSAEPFGLHYSYSCTSDLQSPSPWPDTHLGIGLDGFLAPQASLDAFPNTSIMALFTRDVEDADFDFLAGNVVVVPCGTGNADGTFNSLDCIGSIAEDNNDLTIINPGSDREGFVFTPASDLDPNSWYQVVLGTFNTQIGDDTWTPNAAVPEDQWIFKTRDDTNACEVDSVVVSPQGSHANIYPGGERDFNASALAANCNLCGGEYDWSWTLDHNPGPFTDYADIAPMINGPPSVNQGYTRMTGALQSTENLAVGDNFLTLTAENLDFPAATIGEAFPVVLSPVLRIDDYAPNCDDSCGNATVSVDFNTDLQFSSTDQFAVQQCIAGNCNNLGINLTNSIDNTVLDLVIIDGLTTALASGETYKVTVRQDVVNIYGYELGEDFSWQFTVGDANCEMTGALIYPLNRTVYNMNDVPYRGTATAVGGSCGEQAITCEGCSYDWDTGSNLIATIEFGGIDENNVDATPQSDGTTDIILSIDGTTHVPSYGTELFSTPLTIDTSSVVPASGFDITGHSPDCDGACTNSQVIVNFNEPVDVASLAIAGACMLTNGGAVVPGFDCVLANEGKTIVMEHDTFILGETYRATVRDYIYNMDGEELPQVAGNIALRWEFTIGEADCQIVEVDVQPEIESTGANSSVDYDAVTLANTVSCGNIPVYCDTCDYAWSEAVANDLGEFNLTDIPDVIFTTDPTVVTGQVTQIDLTVDDQGQNFSDFGTLFTVVDTPVPGTVSLIAPHYPDTFPVGCTIGVDCPWECNNMAATFTFDTSDGELNKDSVREQIGMGGECADYCQDREDLENETACVDEGETWITNCWYEQSGNVQFIEEMPYCDNSAFITETTCVDAGAVWITKKTKVIFSPSDILNNYSSYFVGFRDLALVLSDDGIAVADLVGDLIGDFTGRVGGAGASGVHFNTQADMCSVHSVEIEPSADLFTCIEDDCGDEDIDNIAGGNQHEYTAVAYDIQKYVLSSSPMEYTWSSGNDIIVEPETTNGSAILATARTNGNTFLALDAFLNTPEELDNIVSDNAPVTVSTCQMPWPSLSTYPWNESAVPDMNFSTYYCQQYSTEDVSLPQINIPQEVSPSNPLVVLREYISTIYYSTADSGEKNPYLGSLAYYTQEASEEKEVWTDKLITLNTDKVKAAELPSECTPLSAVNLNYFYDGENTVQLTWSHSGRGTNWLRPEGFTIRRALGAGAFSYLDTVLWAGPGNYSFSDTTVAPNENYRYAVIAYNNTCPGLGFPESNPMYPIIETNTNTDYATVDILGFRVMGNPEHLSVSDWYNKYAPNSEQSGTLTQVDGYEALRVGGTSYIAATNIFGGSMYTNIYIIAHNVGARPTTIEIYQQMIDNFKLNINVTSPTAENTCVDQNTLSCSSDFDCPTYCAGGEGDNQTDCEADSGSWLTDTCNSRLAKLRRDTKRLSDLVNIQNSLEDYGDNHKACINNSLISCETLDDCPSSAACIRYYPTLNAGSYLSGLDNSSWPSWQSTFANVLGTSLPVDPISRFNGCEELTTGEYNADTCWDETALAFACPEGSLIYMYSIEDNGQNYNLAANFEYDVTPYAAVTFAANLMPEIPLLMGINVTNASCTDNVIGAPGSYASPSCGNGISGEQYCTTPCIGCDTDELLCNSFGGVIRTEECDSEFWNFACSENPDGSQTALGLISTEWWNEQTIGCNPPGKLDPITGALIECTWYQPNPSLTELQCGGYCGDDTLQSYYEACESATFSGPGSDYICISGDQNDLDCTNCQVTCDDIGVYPAARCGDGVWSEAIEQCDASSNPNGLAGWDCTEGSGVQCDSSCEISCTTGDLYLGSCGNSLIDGICDVPCPDCLGVDNLAVVSLCAAAGMAANGVPGEWTYIEACDYADYSAPDPADTGPLPERSYGCTLLCEMDGTYCGDGTLNANFQEICEYGVGPDQYDTPSPILSHEFNQYNCRQSGVYTDADATEFGACTATLGGWCGDGNIQADKDEDCDPGFLPDGIPPNPAPRDPEDTNIDDQYTCDVDCEGYGGGYCGDGDVQNGVAPFPDYGEDCDYFNFLPPSAIQTVNYYDATNEILQYGCTDMGADICRGFGGWCGDGITNGDEVCDDGHLDFGGFNGTYGYCLRDCSGPGPTCGDGITNGDEVCDGDISCSSIPGPGYVSGVATCVDCQTLEDASCCSENLLHAKFMADNEFELFVNNNPVGSGDHWEQCRVYDYCATRTSGSEAICYSGFNEVGCNAWGSNCIWVTAANVGRCSDPFYHNMEAACTGTGASWTAYADGDGSAIGAGACEFTIDNIGIFDVNRVQGNLLAFKATDLGQGAGVIGNFSCKATRCQSVCYKGSVDLVGTTGCTTNGQCGTNGICITPDNSNICATNADCKPYSSSLSHNIAGNDWENKPSLCLPVDGNSDIRTLPSGDSLWKCVTRSSSQTSPSEGWPNDWREVDYDPTMDLVFGINWNATPPQAPVTIPAFTSGWWGTNTDSYWRHMVPGARTIWQGTAGTALNPKTIYCRYFMAKD